VAVENSQAHQSFDVEKLVWIAAGLPVEFFAVFVVFGGARVVGVLAVHAVLEEEDAVGGPDVIDQPEQRRVGAEGLLQLPERDTAALLPRAEPLYAPFILAQLDASQLEVLLKLSNAFHVRHVVYFRLLSALFTQRFPPPVVLIFLIPPTKTV